MKLLLILTCATVAIAQQWPGSLVVPVNNNSSAIVLQTPTSDNPIYDSSPIAAIFIARPTTPSTRNFQSGLWVETSGGAIDKGRGIGIHNFGASDSLISIADGANGTGIVSYLTPTAVSATGFVGSVTRQDQVGMVLRQEVGITPTAGGNLLTLQADGQVNEMVRVNSTLGGQVGIVYRMNPTGMPFVVLDSAGEIKALLTGAGFFQATAMRLSLYAFPNNASAKAAGLSIGDVYEVSGTDPRVMAIVF